MTCGRASPDTLSVHTRRALWLASCVAGVLLGACVVKTPAKPDSGAALDAGIADLGLDLELPDASLPFDAPSAPFDSPPQPLDAPWVVVDAPPADATYVALDAGPCAPGDYALEDTPIAFAPITLRSPSTTGWSEFWREPTGEWAVHEIANDLESITLGAPLADTPLIVGAFSYEAQPTNAVDVASGATLVVFRPWSTVADHFLVALYGLDGARRTDLLRIDVSADAPIDVAWTGFGYSILVSHPLSAALGGSEAPLTRIELDASGAVTRRVDTAPIPGGMAGAAYADGVWHGIQIGGFGGLGGLVAIAGDGTITTTPGGGVWTFHGAAYSEVGDAYWLLLSPYAVPGPLRLVPFTSTGAGASTALFAIAASPSQAAVAPEDGTTAGVVLTMYSTAALEHWFLRVRDGVVVQRLRLPGSPFGRVFLRYLGDRYVIGWGVFLDELRRCP